MITLLKAKASLHGVIFMFSIGVVLLMLMEVKRNVYPDLPCYVCAVTALLNAMYSAWLLVDCNKEIEEMEARERR